MMIEQKEIEDFFNVEERPPVVDKDDVGKEAVIIDVRIIETPAFNDKNKTYKKLLITIEVGGKKKVIFLSRTLAVDLAEKMGKNLNAWVGKRIILTTIKMTIGKKIIDKVIFEPAPVYKNQNEDLII